MISIKQSTYLIGSIWFTLFILTSCDQEIKVDLLKPEVNTVFDSLLAESLDYMEDDPTRALGKLDQLISEAKTINSKYYTGRAKWYKGYIYDDILEDISQAYNYYSEALKDLERIDDPLLKHKIYNNLGVLYRFYGQYDAAISNYESVLKLKDQLPIEELPEVYYNYGVALRYKGDSNSFVVAERAFEKALEYALEIEHHDDIARVYNIRGLMHKNRKNFQDARLAYYRTIETYSTNSELFYEVGSAYHGIGVTYMEEGNTNEAIVAFTKALEYKSVSRSIFISKLDLGTVLIRAGQVDEAIAIWKDALTEKYNKNSKEHVSIYSNLASALKQVNRPEEALDYAEKYASYMQHILEESENSEDQGNQVLFASAVNEYQNRLAINELQLDRKNLQTNFLIAAVTGSLLFSGLIFKYYRRQKKLSQHLATVGQIAKLKALKAQINPHFLFNTLNSIQSFILDDEKNIAQGYLVKYGQLMRKILDHSNELTVPLNEELEAIKLYVELEQLRIKHGFDFQVELQSDIDLYTTNVPSMVIQPIIENAIWHGVSKLDKKGEIDVKFTLEDERIEVIVSDNGIGFDQAKIESSSNSKGVQLVRERLELLGKSKEDRPAMEVSSEVDRGTKVVINFSGDLK